MKLSELPEGAVVELGNGERYERSLHGYESLDLADLMTVNDMDDRDDVKIISVPYAVTLKLAQWLDDSYTKTFNPESLIIEAAEVVAKENHGKVN